MAPAIGAREDCRTDQQYSGDEGEGNCAASVTARTNTGLYFFPVDKPTGVRQCVGAQYLRAVLDP